jgi:hypothetical protein
MFKILKFQFFSRFRKFQKKIQNGNIIYLLTGYEGIASLLSLRHWLLTEVKPRSIVRVEGTTNLLFPNTVYKYFIMSKNKEMPEVNRAYNKYSQTSLNMDRFKCPSIPFISDLFCRMQIWLDQYYSMCCLRKGHVGVLDNAVWLYFNWSLTK